MKIITDNKKAYFDYFIDETYEAGIVLEGSEVKSVKMGNINLKDSFCFLFLWLECADGSQSTACSL